MAMSSESRERKQKREGRTRDKYKSYKKLQAANGYSVLRRSGATVTGLRKQNHCRQLVTVPCHVHTNARILHLRHKRRRTTSLFECLALTLHVHISHRQTKQVLTTRSK